jgi:hypothetical protein
MKRKKRWRFLARILGILAAGAAFAQNPGDFKTSTLAARDGSGALIITGYTGPAEAELVIPAAINGIPVRGISDNAFFWRYLPYLSVSAPVASITIPAGVTSIGDGAFAGCWPLAAIKVAEGNTAYRSVDGVLFNKEGTALIRYPPGKPGQSYAIPNGVTRIGKEAFTACKNLIRVTIPPSVITIGDFAFAGSAALRTVSGGDGLRSIGNGAFAHCENLAGISLGDGPRSIGKWAFADCGALKSINLGEGVTRIGDFAFERCGALRSIAIPASVTSIQGNAFDQCASLREIRVAEENTAYRSVDGVLFNKAGTALIRYPPGRPDPAYTLPSGVQEIGGGAFSRTAALRRVTTSAGLRSIGFDAFADCESLAGVSIRAGYAVIMDGAFSGCAALTNVRLSRKTRLGKDAFPSGLRLSYID